VPGNAHTRFGAPPRVSVCIPTYNRAAYLRETIESVLAQTFVDFRLVVSDNASTDETPAVVAGFDDPRIVYSRLEENIGLVPNHERCLELADTEFVAVLPDDDTLRPDMLESAVAVLDEHPRVGLVHSAFDLVDADGRTVGTNVDWTALATAEDVYEAGRDYIRNAVATSIRVHVSTAVFRTAALPELRFDPRDHPPVDLALMLRIALEWDVYFVARPLAAIRLHRESFSASNGGTYTDTGFIEDPDYIEKVKEIKLRFLDENRERLSDRDDLLRRARRANSLSHVNAIGRRTWPERRRGETIRLLRHAQRRDPRLLFEPAAWRLLVASLLGPRAVDEFKRRRSALRVATAGGER
jgi:glycosyltransferase involved in cell wall biosynthesis